MITSHRRGRTYQNYGYYSRPWGSGRAKMVDVPVHARFRSMRLIRSPSGQETLEQSGFSPAFWSPEKAKAPAFRPGPDAGPQSLRRPLGRDQISE